MTQRLHAVTLVVPDYDTAIAFYVDTLGFTLLDDLRLSASKRWVRVALPGDDATSLLLARADTPEQQTSIGNQTGGRVGFFLATDDFHRDHSAMTAAGVTFEESPRSEVYGIVAVFRDPFGNRWDLIQFT
ncbi:VOC family protein [Puniceibacterium sp. IMCC21224]|uniref:VOC family protein n=1 Tax=Puniceibacterium sp. IMCC21224 TaxID=1618204 RepID=UPI00064E041B|nr:VOC family protein [Puniceibacterium sp. IMCC21224]KMK67500.1 lactoylglutathione lyase-like lyase [Puniceibacterium sp. IMCC21224]